MDPILITPTLGEFALLYRGLLVLEQTPEVRALRRKLSDNLETEEFVAVLNLMIATTLNVS